MWNSWLGDQFLYDAISETEPSRNGENASQVEREARGRALMPFVVISLSYMLYTFTDGSVRMVVLLAAYNMGFTALEVALMFTLYETAGVVTNVLAGNADHRAGAADLWPGHAVQLAEWNMEQGHLYHLRHLRTNALRHCERSGQARRQDRDKTCDA